jgi:hypothetical protein
MPKQQQSNGTRTAFLAADLAVPRDRDRFTAAPLDDASSPVSSMSSSDDRFPNEMALRAVATPR